MINWIPDPRYNESTYMDRESQEESAVGQLAHAPSQHGQPQNVLIIVLVWHVDGLRAKQHICMPKSFADGDVNEWFLIWLKSL